VVERCRELDEPLKKRFLRTRGLLQEFFSGLVGIEEGAPKELLNSAGDLLLAARPFHLCSWAGSGAAGIIIESTSQSDA